MTASLPVVVFFVANILYCLAYLVTDIVWLRVLTIVAALCTFPYFIFQPQVMYSAVLWQSAFMLINVFNLILLYIRRRPVPLSDRESLVKNMVFRHFTSREAAELLKAAQWRDAAAGQQIVAQGENLDKLYLLYAGKISIIQHGQVVAYRGPGSFIGEIGYMTDAAATADVV
ncbi:MAG: cyclic nucleotide-binding domain-containing protein, partial [Pseudomonadota bacterium]